ncbi:MAG TPA: acyl carrier protein [Gemmataceae bacterium]|jgi:acyl carrier protein
MTAEDIRARIKDAIVKVSKIDPRKIGDHDSFRDHLGMDSLAILEAIVEVQCRFKIPDVSDEEYAALRTLDDAIGLVEKHLGLQAV